MVTRRNVPEPPRKFGEAGFALWRRVHAEFDVSDVTGQIGIAPFSLSRTAPDKLLS
jgi:hypothetical protein